MREEVGEVVFINLVCLVFRFCSIVVVLVKGSNMYVVFLTLSIVYPIEIEIQRCLRLPTVFETCPN